MGYSNDTPEVVILRINKPLVNMTKTELLLVADAKELPGRSKMTKLQLYENLRVDPSQIW
ncbi:hypothetical protein Lepto7375DRAFT_7201 [Leptolyngbya sp. PCC 7375]|nr:hypothetical protein Lepto7375DRAFT_7201 [Leptolyngbya sp. PCC 7375]